jgi:hypothetical protein
MKIMALSAADAAARDAQAAADVDLQPVAVVLDLVNPAVGRGRRHGAGRQAGIDEGGRR